MRDSGIRVGSSGVRMINSTFAFALQRNRNPLTLTGYTYLCDIRSSPLSTS
jgi:hypothetical protein